MALGLLHPGIHQQALHICALVEEGRKVNSLTGQHMRWSVEALTVEAGIQGNIFSHNFHRYKDILTDCWIKSIWQFCTDYSIQIHHPLAVLQAPCGSYDGSLMEKFSAIYSGHTLQQLNMCRMYLHSVFLSDLCTADGKRIAMDSWTGVRRQDRVNVIASWPRTMKPPATWWIRWREALQVCFCSDSQVLRQPVGMVFPARWHWWYSVSCQHLFHLEGQIWRRFKAHHCNTRARSTNFQPQGLLYQVLPRDITPVTVSRRGTSAIIDAQSMPYATDCRRSMSSRNVALPRPATAVWAASQIDESQGTMMELADYFRDHRHLVCINDGSFKKPFTTCASAVTDGRRLVCMGTSIVPGNSDEGSAYRGELGGVITTLEMVSRILDMLPYPHRQGSITIHLDGHAAMTKSRDSKYLNPSNPSFDLLQEIEYRVTELPCEVEWSWVKGHDILSNESSWETRMNHRCDTFAKQRLRDMFDQEMVPPNWVNPPQGWSVQLGSHHFMSSISRMPIYDWVINQTELSPQKYWLEKHSMQGVQGINWAARASASKRLSQSQRIWLVKHWSGWCAVGVRAKLRGHQPHAQCPRCECITETPLHVLGCKGSGAAAVWRSLLLKLEVWLDGVNTAPFITSSILHGLKHWHSGDSVDGESHPHPVYLQQTTIGWVGFLQGYHSEEWQSEQEKWYSSTGSSRSASRWASLLVEKIWLIGKDMWTHRNEVCHGPNRSEPLALRQELEQQAKQIDQQVQVLGIQDVPPLGQLDHVSTHRLEIWLEGARGMIRRREKKEPSSLDPTLVGMRKTMASWLGKSLKDDG